MNPLLAFLLMLKASLFSFNGTGNLPILRADLVPLGYATDHQFVEALAVGQVSPGPNGLWVIGLGYLMDGPRGAALAAVAICLPPLLVLPLSSVYRRIRHLAWVDGFMRGLSLAVVSVFAAFLFGVAGAAGMPARSIAVAAGALALTLSGRASPIAVIGAAAAVGLLFH